MLYVSEWTRIFVWVLFLMSPSVFAQELSFDSDETSLEAIVDEKTSDSPSITETLDDDYSIALRRFDAGEFAEAGSLFDRVFEL